MAWKWFSIHICKAIRDMSKEDAKSTIKKYRPVPGFSPLFGWTINGHPPNKRLRVGVSVAALFLAILALVIAPMVCSGDVGFKSVLVVMCGPFGRFVIADKCKWGSSGVICVSMIICSTICFWGRRGPKSEGCMIVLFLLAWLSWLFLGIGYFIYWR